MLNFKYLLGPGYWSGGHDFNNCESSLYIQLIFDVNNDISCAVILEKIIFKTITIFSLFRYYLSFKMGFVFYCTI